MLALIPLAAEVFWAPMALAMMGGLIAATVLTLTFLPALYAFAFRVTIPGRSGAGTGNPPNVAGVPPNVQAALQIAAE